MNKLLLNPRTIDLVIYHCPCMDGFGSAFAVWKLVGDQAEYFPCQIGKDPPDVTGRNVLICDYSYSYDILTQMIQDANSLAILDHHKTAEADLQDIPPEYKIFDMNHSGAYLTWTFCHPNEPVPPLISYIQDRDIWTKELPQTNEFTAGLFTIPFEFEEYDKLLDPQHFQNCINKGTILLAQQQDHVEWLSNKADVKLVQINGSQYLAAFLNSPIYQSELGNHLMNTLNIDFAAIYSHHDKHGATRFSLRSLDTKADVSQIAKVFGGGGHRNAAGLSIDGLVNTLGDVLLHHAWVLESVIHQEDGTVQVQATDLSDQETQYLQELYGTFELVQ